MGNEKLLKTYFGLIFLDFIFLFLDMNLAHLSIVFLIAPLILLIYFRIIKEKYKWYFLIVLLFNYFTDLIHFFVEADINNLWCAYFNIIAYCALTFFVIKNLELKKIKDLDSIVYLSFAIASGLFIYVAWVAYTIISTQNLEHNNYYFLVFYIIVMIIMSVIVTIKYIVKPNMANTSLEILIACFVISDLFYLMNLIYPKIIAFKYFYIIPQLLLYYFLLRYELNRNRIFEIK